MGERIEKIKIHLKENKATYITGASCLVVGAAGAILWKGNFGNTANVTQGIAYKSPVTTHVIQQMVPRAGHAGKVFVDRDDPTKYYMSVRKLADALKISPQAVRKYLAGEVPDLAGHHFDMIADGAPPMLATQTLSA